MLRSSAKRERLERLYWRADAIFDGSAHGLGEPILWHLALRHHPDAMLALASRISRGRRADPFSGRGLQRRAYRLGSYRAAQHAAVDAFNDRRLADYRTWLRRGAQAGDQEAAAELQRFETRLPHRAARAIGRGRPYRPDDGLWKADRHASKPTKWYPPDPFRPRSEQ